MNEHNPDNLTPEQYGAPEWRLLRKGETPCLGDESDVGASGTNWTPLDGNYDAPVETLVLTYRRRVSPPSPETDAANPPEIPDSSTELSRLRAELAEGRDRDKAITAFIDSPEVFDLLTVSPLTLAQAGRALRAVGHSIPEKMEQECGYVLRSALHKIVEHGPKWREAFAAQFQPAEAKEGQ